MDVVDCLVGEILYMIILYYIIFIIYYNGTTITLRHNRNK